MRTCARCKHEWEDDYRLCPYDGQPLGDDTVAPLVTEALFGGRYEILRLLGEGGIAKVFKAFDVETKTNVAIKVALGVVARTPPWPERMLREVQLLQTIRHPNVIEVLGGGQQADGAPYIVMEYLEGQTLGARMRSRESIPIETAISITLQVARGLGAAHAVGVIHRDIKPDNIFLVGGGGVAKVFDFGMARLQGGMGLTAKGFILGTPAYMAPEQAVNDKAGPRSDVYALGIVMYRMLTGILPFDGNEIELLAAQLYSLPRHPSSLRKEIPRDVDAVVMSALKKLARNRYPSMQDFAEDLEKLLGKREGKITADFAAFDDVYEPQSAFSKAVATTLKKKVKAPTD